MKNLTPINFAVDDKYFHATIDKMEGGKIMQSLLVSNDPIYINHFNSIFEELWKNGTDAAQRIKDIEEGADVADIEVFQNVPRAREVYLELVKQATKEILFIFPTLNAFSRQHKIGAVGLAKKAAVEHNVMVRILMPAPTNNLVGKTFENLPDYLHKIDIRYIAQMSETKATILVVDRKESLVMELRDDSKTTFDEAIGLSTYSNSKAGVLSYVAIFENLWKQTELYEQSQNFNKMQNDFVNIAAHELRTPIQPILGLSGLLLRDKQTEKKRQELLEIIFRNAKRLERLTEDILDITRIESKSLELKKERFNLSEILRNATADFQNQINKEYRDTNLKLQFIGPEKDIIIKADKGRINQVVSNFISNAIKFTQQGNISTIVGATNNDEVIISTKDTGLGIDSEILPRLFTKFATKSTTGTGLGLYISKNIIQAHGGTIWAENNKDGGGATFSFKIPIGS
jgi:signal transduction histidine kinase